MITLRSQTSEIIFLVCNEIYSQYRIHIAMHINLRRWPVFGIVLRCTVGYTICTPTKISCKMVIQNAIPENWRGNKTYT